MLCHLRRQESPWSNQGCQLITLAVGVDFTLYKLQVKFEVYQLGLCGLGLQGVLMHWHSSGLSVSGPRPKKLLSGCGGYRLTVKSLDHSGRPWPWRAALVIGLW